MVKPKTHGLLSLSQAAKSLGLSPETLRRQARRGVLRAPKIGYSYIVNGDEVERYRREHLGKMGQTRIVSVPLDTTQLGYFVHEVELQCSLTLHAYDMIHAALGIKEMSRQVEGAIAYCHTMLTHAGNVSKLLWPSRPFHLDGETEQEYKQREKNQERRGKQVCAALGVTRTSPLRSRRMRDHLEHYDERLETFLRKPHPGGLIDMSFPGSLQPGQEAHRIFDPGQKRFIFQGEQTEMIALADALHTVRDAANKWLANNGHRDPCDMEDRFNEADYTLRFADFLPADVQAILVARRAEKDALFDELGGGTSADG